MTRALRIVLIASLLMMSLAVTGISPAGAAGPAVTQVSQLTTRAGCSLMSDHTVRCSGYNDLGQLGDGNFIASSKPVVVRNAAGNAALSGIVQVVTGSFFACARTAQGTAACWGENKYGQLGVGGPGGPSPLPVQVRNASNSGPLTGIVQLAAGKYHACARMANGTINCWGHNGYYELGDGTNVSHFLPHLVTNSNHSGVLTGALSIGLGQYHTCAALGTGAVYCWGLNQFGYLGDGTTKFKALPTRVRAISGPGFLTNVSQITVAPAHTCALLRNRTVDCWGLNNFGQLGDGTLTTRVRPVQVKNGLGNTPLVNVLQVSAGGGAQSGDHTCARLVNSTAMCWGSNDWGQLGDGTRSNRIRPVAVKGTIGNAAHPNILGVFVGPVDSCAVIKGGTAKCWGFNQGGQFGNGTAKNSIRPVPALP